MTFSNPLKNIYYNYIIKLDPYSLESVLKLLKKFRENINIIKGDSNVVLKEISIIFDYVFLDGGHKYETVLDDLKSLTKVIENKIDGLFQTINNRVFLIQLFMAVSHFRVIFL